MGRKNNISGTKKADSEANGFEISFIKKDIRRSSNTVQDEHEHLMCAFPLRLRYASAITRRPNHLSGTNVNDLIEIKKKFDKKIRDWQKGGDINLGDFMMFIALELRFRASESNDKTHSYYVSVYESNNKYTLRISDHHFNARTTDKDNAIHTTSITFDTPIDDKNHEEWDFFTPSKNAKATEYVYYESEIDKDKLIAIAKDVFAFIETGKYTPSVKPNEINHSPKEKTLQGLSGTLEPTHIYIGTDEKYKGKKLYRVRLYDGNSNPKIYWASILNHDYGKIKDFTTTTFYENEIKPIDAPYIIEEPTPAPDNDRERRLRLAKARAKAMVMLQEQRNRETEANKVKKYKVLTQEDIKMLLSAGVPTSDLAQIDDAGKLATIKIAEMPETEDDLEKFKKLAWETTLDEASKYVDRKQLIFGLNRLAFHGWSGSVWRGNSEYTIKMSIPKEFFGLSGAETEQEIRNIFK